MLNRMGEVMVTPLPRPVMDRMDGIDNDASVFPGKRIEADQNCLYREGFCATWSRDFDREIYTGGF